MSVTEERQQKMLQSIHEKTGLPPDAIIEELKEQNLEKHNQKIAYIKEKYSLSHGFANLLAHKSKEDNSSSIDFVANQYHGKEQLLAIYKRIIEFVNQFEEVEIAPKKAYVSIRAKKQFAIIQPSTKTRLDLGLKYPNSYKVPLEKSGNFNGMVSHRIRIEKMEDFNEEVREYLKKAHEMSF